MSDGSVLKGVTIRPLRPSDSLQQLTALLHRAYKILADMGLRYLATHQSVEITRDRIAKGTCFVAELDSRIIGSVTYYGPETVTRIPWMDEDRVAWFGQFGVEPHLQGQGIGSRLVDHVEAFAGAHDVDQLALDTAEPATHLIEWYERLGYEFVEYVNWEETNYRSVIMRKRLR